MEKRQERDRDNKKEHATKLITPQVAKLEHTYRPGRNTLQSHSDKFAFMMDYIAFVSGYDVGLFVNTIKYLLIPSKVV